VGRTLLDLDDFSVVRSAGSGCWGVTVLRFLVVSIFFRVWSRACELRIGVGGRSLDCECERSRWFGVVGRGVRGLLPELRWELSLFGLFSARSGDLFVNVGCIIYRQPASKLVSLRSELTKLPAWCLLPLCNSFLSTVNKELGFNASISYSLVPKISNSRYSVVILSSRPLALAFNGVY